MTSIYKLALLLLFILPLHSAQSTYYITPTPGTPCPVESCLSFVEHTRQGGGHLENATLVFLPGTHTIESSIEIGNLTSLTLLGDSSSLPEVTSMIVCSQPASVSFQCIENLLITALGIASCGFNDNGTVVVAESCGSENNAHYNLNGAAVVAALVQSLTISNCHFQNEGGALAVVSSSLTVLQTTFKGNSAFQDRGSVDIRNSVANFNGNSFVNNSGGGVLLLNTTACLSRNLFESNRAVYYGGGVALVIDSVGNFTENVFMNNVAGVGGGGIVVISSTATFKVNTIFLRNSANISGGAVFIRGCTVHFSGKTNFTTNSAQLFGGAITIVNSTVGYHGDINFDNNTANSGGGIEAKDSYITFQQNTTFHNNSAVNGGAVYAVHCYINFEGENIFMKNSAYRDGGGLLLTSGSKCYLHPNATISFANNTAMRNGGAIKVDDNNPLAYCLATDTSATTTPNECFFQLNSSTALQNRTQLNNFNATMEFDSNTAGKGGSDIYGGAVDNCELQSVQFDQCCDFLSSKKVLNIITGNTPETLHVSSDPLHICRCENNEANCDSSSITTSTYPGGKFNISVIAIGQRDGHVSAVLRADRKQRNVEFNDLQNINNMCTDIEYTVFSLVEEFPTQEDITLYVQGPCSREERSLELRVEVLHCPHGLELSRNTGACVCSKRLEKFTNTCIIESGTILRPDGASFWVSYSNKRNGLILHPQCPFDYCISEESYVSVDNSSMQCNYSRNGTLCGECIQNLSLVFGSSRCLQCSNSHLALLAAFAFAGIALVFFLFLLKLTVAVGTINGLIFYANVVQVNSAVFFQPGTANILTVFIAWLNLDLGIETCFYDGMDAYAKTWLQFLFPVYVWILVGIIILFSHYSQMISSLLGKNPIAVLCTLFLLSYAKVLRTIIVALSFTILEYPDSHQTVWLHDGNIRYFTGGHVPLFLVALSTLLFLFLPFSLLLFCGQWLQGKSDSRVFSWINKPAMKSFLDAYHAPYAGKHRYWTGLLLLTRSSLFLIFAFNALGDPHVNLFCITTITLAIITIGFVAEKIYVNRYLGTLEASFVINLGILAAATTSFDRQAALTYTSVSIAFVTFIGIVVYHFHLQLKDNKLWMKIANSTLDTFHRRDKCTLNEEDNVQPLTTPTKSEVSVSLREPLLEDEI